MRKLHRIIMAVPLAAASTAFAAEPLNDQQLDGLNAGFAATALALSEAIGGVVSTYTFAAGAIGNVTTNSKNLVQGAEAGLPLVGSTAVAISGAQAVKWTPIPLQ